ncbi:uncharacterized protein LOC120076323 [Benincasa hispida]|uniref:uncharacterized protein LOC120076323 n=1 Tax=Benincasa hispida TaxID=102211 RepID=UPI0019021712|nr:uncharacterized protein LOC120076323 [Benincasa hispida]XP_038886033.1 uncharacterized protein LOC120076323 [Benincasa hispida]XP_038886034.1 uncharacterized protein LOC120076323 [Benincasa hispida]XP_038886035.1 uncharacterized protein LOC120076323 [Benincasa hispida]XP_038886036.1 uncharacterized protein LOC120076323 [Benincasa hispida]XP_038886037.1 uncharacterized protein LOC120076323 [Benincasa hispida]XP_038886038.1 uncharacterized protein LOC120076323 [Benincasa hispida]XP_03888603
MTSPNCAPESLECNYSSSELQRRVMSNNPIGLSCQEKINQEDVIQSSYSACEGNSCTTTKINCSSVDVFDNNADGIGAFEAPSSMKPSFSYVDKSVTECQVSKTIVCDQEINVNDVKDICIDEGVSSLDNFFFKCTEEKSISKIMPLEEDQNEGSIKEKENSSEVSKFIADDHKVYLEDHFAMEWTTHDDAKDLTQIEEEKFNLSEPKVLMQKLVKRSYSSESLDNIDVQISGEKVNSEDPSLASKSVESCNGTPALGAAAKPPNDNNIPTHPSGCTNESENGSITLNFNSISPVANGGEEHHGNPNLNYPAPMTSSAGTQECHERSDSVIGTQVSTNLEHRTSDSRLVSNQSLHDIGESSFSAVDPLASLVTYSGPIAYSGSISLRSESSTTSTRSFAFPILQSEWNSSPVKMVKAERRHYRKYRGWREGLLCCKF